MTNKKKIKKSKLIYTDLNFDFYEYEKILYQLFNNKLDKEIGISISQNRFSFNIPVEYLYIKALKTEQNKIVAALSFNTKLYKYKQFEKFGFILPPELVNSSIEVIIAFSIDKTNTFYLLNKIRNIFKNTLIKYKKTSIIATASEHLINFYKRIGFEVINKKVYKETNKFLLLYKK